MIRFFYIFVLCTLSSLLYANELPSNEIDKNTKAGSSMFAMTDEELSEVQGQALFSLSYLAPGAATNYYNASNGNVGFYTLGLEAQISLNANIKNLQVGCGGENGAGACDIDIQNFSLGCIANSSGVCISLPSNTIGSATNNPATHTTSSSTVADNLANQQQMKDFVLTNPFFQFAIKDADKASTREIMGVRIGAANAKGPMSFNDIINFSGYLSGKADITMQKKDNLAFTTNSVYLGNGDRSQTFPIYPGANPGPGPGTCTSNCTNGSLGLADWNILLWVYGSDVRADITKDISRTWGVSNQGNRFNLAYIRNANLDSVVNDVVDSVANVESKDGLGGLYDLLFPLLKSGVKSKVKEQLANGLGISVSQLSNFDLKYNLSNVGALEIDSPTFGLTVQKQDLYYPGFVQYDLNGNATSQAVVMTKGWAMYLPSAFTLNIAQPLDMFTSAILGGGAKAGNIVGLPAPYRNCYGTLTFC
ncbi:hypothetical protein [Acinetobacter sp. Marseille-Q1623]|uniref:hypothetical protein n=1 Tax=Acinetobacter sp. Marseille-Q1623 TaxID=2697501 RepID=UPI00157A2DA3|nr:hypothetical protein [Acinetobacter sp. Marseille-Q1623]